MADTSSYPVYPYRPNFTDIRSMQIFDPIVADAKNDIISANYVQLYPTGGTLENGVRIKNTYTNSRVLYVATYNRDTHTGTTGGGGFELGNREEVFIEIRQLANLYIKGAAGTNGTCTFIAS